MKGDWIRFPLAVWLKRAVENNCLELRFRDKHLRIGRMVVVSDTQFGMQVTLYDNVAVSHSEIGNYTYVAPDTKISSAVIGKFCSIGPGVRIGLGRHPSRGFVSTYPAFFSTGKQCGMSFVTTDAFEEILPIDIGNDVWIGAGAVIADGVSIADGAIVGAGAVVVRDVPSYAVVGGVPSRILRYRFLPEQVSVLLATKWWDWPEKQIRSNLKLFHDIETFARVFGNGPRNAAEDNYEKKGGLA